VFCRRKNIYTEGGIVESSRRGSAPPPNLFVVQPCRRQRAAADPGPGARAGGRHRGPGARVVGRRVWSPAAAPGADSQPRRRLPSLVYKNPTSNPGPQTHAIPSKEPVVFRWGLKGRLSPCCLFFCFRVSGMMSGAIVFPVSWRIQSKC